MKTTIEDLKKIIKEKNLLERYVSTQDTMLTNMQKEIKEGNLKLADLHAKLKNKETKLVSLYDLLLRVLRGHYNGDTELTPHFRREIEQTLKRGDYDI